MNLLKAVHDNNLERVRVLMTHDKLNVNMTDNHNFSGKLNLKMFMQLVLNFFSS